MPSHDEETAIVDAAERAAVYYKTLRRDGIDDLPARALTVGWLLATTPRVGDRTLPFGLELGPDLPPEFPPHSG